MTGRKKTKRIPKLVDGETVYGILETFFIDGKEVTEAEYLAAFPDKKIKAGDDLLISTTWNNPVRSDALGVNPRQRQAAIEHSIKHGVPTEYDEQGRAVLLNRAHRKKLMKTLGFHDLNGGYGDG